jgi:AcrR family transcriptional regulator
LAEAARLFAERGFNRVTVREICVAAKANVASVNYHFGDKDGLYAEIVESGLAELETGAPRAGDAETNGDAAARLGAFVRGMIEQLLAPRPDTHVQQLLMHEMTDPTPMFDRIAKGVMRPRLSYLCKLVGELMDRPPADRVVVNAAASVQAQCLMVKSTAMKSAPIDELADHITRFSLAGIRELGERRHDKH